MQPDSPNTPLSETGHPPRYTDPQADFLPPTVQPVYAPGGGQPGQPRERTPRYSEWDPRSAPATYLLLAINIGVYLWMGFSGVSWADPTPMQLLHFGANDAVLVLADGQWQRLLTSTFVHIGRFHIAGNMWCLWNLGLLGEQLTGPWGMIAIYVLTGVAGNLLSIAISVALANYYHVSLMQTSAVVAGASGAVFGITGVLIVLLSNKRLPIPWSELKRLRASVVRFAAINLVIGLATNVPGLDRWGRIDNAAHIGGFAFGLALGLGLVPRMTAGRARYLGRQRMVFVAGALVLSLVGYWIANFT